MRFPLSFHSPLIVCSRIPVVQLDGCARLLLVKAMRVAWSSPFRVCVFCFLSLALLGSFLLHLIFIFVSTLSLFLYVFPFCFFFIIIIIILSSLLLYIPTFLSQFSSFTAFSFIFFLAPVIFILFLLTSLHTKLS